MHPTAWLFGCLAFFYTFRFWECRFSHAVVQLIEVRGSFFCACAWCQNARVQPHIFIHLSALFVGSFALLTQRTCFLCIAFCALKTSCDIRLWLMTNVYFKHSTEFIMAIIFEMQHGNLPSIVKKKLWDFCVKPSSFAFKSLQLHSSLLQFVNIGSDFHIWFSTTFLGHQNKTIQKTTRVWTTALLFSRHGNDLRHLFFGWNLGAKLETQTCPERQTVPLPWNEET